MEDTTEVENTGNAEKVSEGGNVEVNDNVEVKSEEIEVSINEDAAAKVEQVQNKEQYIPDEIEGISCKLAEAEDYITTSREGSVKIRFSGEKGSLTAQPAISVMEFVDRSVKKFGSRTALKVERDDKWISWTYNEYFQEIKTAAKGLIKVTTTI